MALFEKFIDQFVYFDIKRNINKSIQKNKFIYEKKLFKIMKIVVTEAGFEPAIFRL